MAPTPWITGTSLERNDFTLTATVIQLVTFVVVMVVLTGLGVWLGVWASRKMGYIPQDGSWVSHVRARLRQQRQQRRESLTTGERIFARTVVVLSVVLVPAGIIILLSGDSGLRPLGVALLVLGLVVIATPISPILQARIHKRERDRTK